jgi:hypothetical protein
MSREQWLWMQASVSLIAAAARAMRLADEPAPAHKAGEPRL